MYTLIWVSRPLYTPFLSRALGYPASVVVIAQTGLSLGVILLGRSIGQLVDKHSFRRMLAFGAAIEGIAIMMLAWLPHDGGVMLLGALSLGLFALIGVAETALGLAIGRERFSRTPAINASEYLGLSNATIGLGGAVGAMVGGSLPSWLRVLGGAGDTIWQVFILQALVLFIFAGGLALGTHTALQHRRS